MLIASPEDRAVAWHDTVTAPADVRAVRLLMLAATTRELIGPPLDLYDGVAERLDRSYVALDLAGFLGKDPLRQAFEELDGESSTARAFVHRLQLELDEAASVRPEQDAEDVRGLADGWRADLLVALEQAEADEYLAVADVAAAYDVTPQAVYKWVEKGRIDSERTPGGRLRIPAAQFASVDFERIGRARDLRRELQLDRPEVPRASREETAALMKRRRRGNV